MERSIPLLPWLSSGLPAWCPATLLPGIMLNLEIAALALAAGLVLGMPLARGCQAGAWPRAACGFVAAGLRAIPTFVAMFFLLNVIPHEFDVAGTHVAPSGLVIVALSLVPYSASCVADNAAEARMRWRAGERLAALLILPNLARVFFVLVVSSGAGAAIGVTEGITVILRHAETLTDPADRARLFALGIACFAIPLQAGFLAVNLLRRFLVRAAARAMPPRQDAVPNRDRRNASMPDRAPAPPPNVIRLLLIALSVSLVAFAVLRALPPRTVTIETGPVGGSYYEIALKYRDLLREKGIDLVLRPNPDSLGIVADVDRMDAGVDIGFTAQALDHKRFKRTRAAGAVQLQPLFVFAQTRLGGIAALSRLRGLRIVMPPERSATSEAALAVLRLSGVIPANTPVRFLPLAEAVATLRADGADVGIFMLDPSNAFVTELLGDASLRPVSFGEGSAVIRHLPFLRLAVLPHGSFAIDANTPPEDVTLLAATVNVVVRRDLHPAVLFLLFEAMKEVHHGATMVSDVGAFPSIAGTELVPHPLAVEFAKGGMPWIYRNLPLPVASLIDHYLIIGIALLVLAEIYKNLKYLREMTNVVVESLCLQALGTIERATAQGQSIGRTRMLAVRLAEQALVSTNKRQRGQELIGQIRQRGGA